MLPHILHDQNLNLLLFSTFKFIQGKSRIVPLVWNHQLEVNFVWYYIIMPYNFCYLVNLGMQCSPASDRDGQRTSVSVSNYIYIINLYNNYI